MEIPCQKTDLLIPLLKSKFEKFGVNININKMKKPNNTI